MTKTIPLSGKKGAGLVALVSDQDYERVAQHKWYLAPKGYAQTQVYDPEAKKQNTLTLHRLVLGLERGDRRKVDHLNRNKLDNTRENIRIATTAQNLRNRRQFNGARSRHKGVAWNGRHQCWHVTMRIGLYDDEDLAAEVYQWATEKLFDEQHRLRFWTETGRQPPTE